MRRINRTFTRWSGTTILVYRAVYPDMVRSHIASLLCACGKDKGDVLHVHDRVRRGSTIFSARQPNTRHKRQAITVYEGKAARLSSKGFLVLPCVG